MNIWVRKAVILVTLKSQKSENPKTKPEKVDGVLPLVELSSNFALCAWMRTFTDNIVIIYTTDMLVFRCGIFSPLGTRGVSSPPRTSSTSASAGTSSASLSTGGSSSGSWRSILQSSCSNLPSFRVMRRKLSGNQESPLCLSTISKHHLGKYDLIRLIFIIATPTCWMLLYRTERLKIFLFIPGWFQAAKL